MISHSYTHNHVVRTNTTYCQKKKRPGTLIGLTLTAGGQRTKLAVYLIENFHFKSIVATQKGNIVNGSTFLLPVLAAIIADSLLGCYSVIWISSSFSFLVMCLICFAIGNSYYTRYCTLRTHSLLIVHDSSATFYLICYHSFLDY